MSIYEYCPDSDSFESFLLKSSKDEKTINRLMDCKSIGKAWAPLAIKIDQSMGGKSDFPSMEGIPVFSERAWRMLEPLIGRHVEALPIRHPKSDVFYAINVLEMVDALDRKKSVVDLYPNGKVMSIEKYVFKATAIRGKSIFKIPETHGVLVFVSEEFRSCVERSKMKGLIFKRLD